MHEHVTSVAAEFRRVSDRKMPLTTMRAIKENVSLTAQLRNLSEKSQKLMEENQALREKEKTLRRELEVLEPLLKKMTFKSVCNQKVELEIPGYDKPSLMYRHDLTWELSIHPHTCH